MPHLFRIWNASRTKKKTVVIKDSIDIINNLLNKSGETSGIKGASIVMEKCGSIVDDDDVLIMLSSKEVILIIQQVNESWKKNV